jgi:MFS family permease
MHGSIMISENGYDSNRAKGEFVRTQFTWLAYALLGYYGCLQTSVGPLMAFLRTELQLNYTIEGLHFSAWAFGAILAGINGDYAIRILGRRSVLWGGGAGMAAGAIALIMARQPLWTLLSIVLVGYAGNLLLIPTGSSALSLCSRATSWRAWALSWRLLVLASFRRRVPAGAALWC